MFRKVLVPLDGSDLAATALDFLEPILQVDPVSVVVLRVVEASQRDQKPKSIPNQGSEKLERLKPEAQVSSLERRGDPAEQILATARDEDVSLIAMSTHGRSGISRLVRGSVAERVLRKSHVPILLTSPLTEQRPPKSRVRRILVPLDGSSLSAAVLPLVADVAKAYGSHVTLFHVGLPDYHESSVAEKLEAAKEEEFRESVTPFVAQLEEAGTPVSVRVVFELGPASQILAAVESLAIDLVALATHGRSGLGRWAYGSVAEHVIRQCRSPLLVKRTASSR